MKAIDRKCIEEIRENLQVNLEQIEGIRDSLRSKAEIEILTDAANSVKEAIDNLGEV